MEYPSLQTVKYCYHIQEYNNYLMLPFNLLPDRLLKHCCVVCTYSYVLRRQLLVSVCNEQGYISLAYIQMGQIGAQHIIKYIILMSIKACVCMACLPIAWAWKNVRLRTLTLFLCMHVDMYNLIICNIRSPLFSSGSQGPSLTKP